jgi:ABC-type transport system involved in multi-copper enzyme maturation permease subunit
MRQAEITLGTARPSRRERLVANLGTLTWENPVVQKELRGRMRGRRAFVVLTVYLFLLSCITSVVYFAYASAAQQPYGPDSYLIGKVVFGGVLGLQVLLVIFITPAFTAGAISGERERQTYDLLRTTLLPARALVSGKLISALAYVVLLIVAAIPLESIAFLLGGVAIEEVILSQLILLATALALGAVSVYISTRARSTLMATVLSYGFAFLTTGGLPLLFAILSPILGFGSTLFIGVEEPSWALIVLLVYIGGFLLAINPIATIVASEIVLLEEQTIWFFKISVPSLTGVGSHTLPIQNIWLVSPWVVYVLFYSLLAALAYWLAVRRVRRTER